MIYILVGKLIILLILAFTLILDISVKNTTVISSLISLIVIMLFMIIIIIGIN
uniref:Uncharacterized protein n=1 Tax=Myoviridae sp. ctXXl13 TaxID=2827691 RepID=A0A8S5TIZ5_9CAUD|nr:MAG TPA: hypothetical protein [Myoviridae sp. ctXXl13]